MFTTRTARIAAVMAAAIPLGWGLLAGGPAKAQDVSDFFAGKTMNIVVGHEAGTGFDIYSRVIIRHMGRHIPGAPVLIVQNMPGASGIQSANWLYNIAPKDGTVMATFSQNVPLEPLFGNTRAKFDPSRFIWIGNAEQSISVCGVSASSGVKSFDELMQREVIFGATGPTGPLVKAARAVKNVLGAKMKIVTGYKGSASVRTAMLNKEVAGICGLPWSTIKSFWRSDVESGDFKAILQLSGEPTEEIGKVPHIRDFAKTDEDRALFSLLFGVQVLGRAYVMPPGVPAERVKAIREAFMNTMKDPKFLDDARKGGLDISPMAGEKVGALWDEFARAPKELVERARDITSK